MTILNPFHLLFLYCCIVAIFIGTYWTLNHSKPNLSSIDDLESIEKICRNFRNTNNIKLNKFDSTKGRICIEKTSLNDPNYSLGSKPFRAIFQKKFLWNPSDTIRVSFLQLPEHYPGVQYLWDGSIRSDTLKFNLVENDLNPRWLPKTHVLMNTQDTLTPEEEKFEQQVRLLNPVEGIKWVVKEKLQPFVGVNFEFVEEPIDSDVRISLSIFEPSQSMIGTDCKNEPKFFSTMNFNHLSVQTILHEFCHVLGMVHEHQNPFGKPIQWNADKVFEYYAKLGVDKSYICRNILDRYKDDSVNGSVYDPKSIMLYHFPSELVKNGIGIPENIRLSELDIQWLKTHYPK